MDKQPRKLTLYHNNGKPVRFNKEPGRNEVCTCGSGIKYKNCCLKLKRK